MRSAQTHRFFFFSPLCLPLSSSAILPASERLGSSEGNALPRRRLFLHMIAVYGTPDRWGRYGERKRKIAHKSRELALFGWWRAPACSFPIRSVSTQHSRSVLRSAHARQSCSLPVVAALFPLPRACAWGTGLQTVQMAMRCLL
jgi:hypothetical protein